MAADAVLLNSVQKGLNDWKKAILSVTRLDRDVSSGDAMTEINFWLSMDAALNRIQAQLKSPEIGLFSPLQPQIYSVRFFNVVVCVILSFTSTEFTFELLKQNKRFLATTGFHNDSGLQQAKEKGIRIFLLIFSIPPSPCL